MVVGGQFFFYLLFTCKPHPVKCPNTHFFRVEKGRTNQDSWEAGHPEAPLKPLKEAEFGKLEFLLQFQSFGWWRHVIKVRQSEKCSYRRISLGLLSTYYVRVLC